MKPLPLSLVCRRRRLARLRLHLRICARKCASVRVRGAILERSMAPGFEQTLCMPIEAFRIGSRHADCLWVRQGRSNERPWHVHSTSVCSCGRSLVSPRVADP
jgi:hypothetical protein